MARGVRHPLPPLALLPVFSTWPLGTIPGWFLV